MGRKAAWEELADAEFGAATRPRGSSRWSKFFGLLLLVAVATFVAAFYVPLFRAHERLNVAYRELGRRAERLNEQLRATALELTDVKASRDRLQQARDEALNEKRSDADRAAAAQSALRAKLDRYVKKGSASVLQNDGSLRVVLDGSLVFAAASLEVSALGRSLLCDVAKTSNARSIQVRDVLSEGASAPAALAKSYATAWSLSAARAAAVTQELEAHCALPAAQLRATGGGSAESSATLAQKPLLDRIELVLELP